MEFSFAILSVWQSRVHNVPLFSYARRYTVFGRNNERKFSLNLSEDYWNLIGRIPRNSVHIISSLTTERFGKHNEKDHKNSWRYSHFIILFY